MHLRKWLVALFLICLAQAASAMSLGEGQILNRVGEVFSANIALNGSYSKDVSFSQVGNAECRASDIGNTANGCASLYSGHLSFSIKQWPDGRYFLNVTGEKGNELFYRVLIKSTSAAAGTIFKLYEFLPEFKQNPDEPLAANDVVPSGHDDVKVNEPVIKSLAVKADLPKAPARQQQVSKQKRPATIRHKPADITKDNRDEVLLEKPLQTRLEIKKSGEYGDEIQALTKENGEIEAQINLLEKHIGLLKEVIRLKNEAGATTKTPVVRPKAIPLQIQTVQSNQPGLLTWILFSVVVVFAALLACISQKLKRLSLKYASAALSTTEIATASTKEKKSLDLTGAFTKPKW
jgi:hypothetical protein